jgi:hypothetical protein
MASQLSVVQPTESRAMTPGLPMASRATAASGERKPMAMATANTSSTGTASSHFTEKITAVRSAPRPRHRPTQASVTAAQTWIERPSASPSIFVSVCKREYTGKPTRERMFTSSSGKYAVA